MASIEKTEEHVVREVFVMKYDRAELEERAANPMLIVREIESALNGQSERKPGKVLAVRMKKHVKPVRAVKPKAGRKAATFQCTKCDHKPFSSQGRLDQHDRTAHADDLGNIEIGSYRPAD